VIPEQRASYMASNTAAPGGEFQPPVAPQTAPPVANQFASAGQSGTTLGPPVSPSSAYEPPTHETASTMPLRGMPDSAPPSAPPQPPVGPLAPSRSPEVTGPGPVAPAGAALVLASAAPPPAGSQQAPPLGLDGYCPVTLFEHEKWVKGDPKYGAFHRGRTYLFAGPHEQARFLNDRGYEKYAPALSGFDAVKYAEQGLLVDGKRVHGVFYHKQVFLFADEVGLQQFWADPERYATTVRAEHERSAMRSSLQR
jgi:hypothetical protein